MNNGGTETHSQSIFMDRNLSGHQLSNRHSIASRQSDKNTDDDDNDEDTALLSSSSSMKKKPMYTLTTTTPTTFSGSDSNSCSSDHHHNHHQVSTRSRKQSIRFQVVVWNMGSVDVAEGRVPVTFRVTIFWNDHHQHQQQQQESDDDDLSASFQTHASWQMSGRRQAVQRETREIPLKTIEVPPVSILNAVTFEIIGSPDVTMLREDTRLMRWTCMYRASLVQNHWRVENFPHDQHDIKLNLAILSNRGPGREWDRRVWGLGLATDDDSQGSTSVPHGLVVKHVRVPDFIFDRQEGLQFDLVEIEHGPDNLDGHEICLEVKLTVLRHSSYYDNNIMPLLALLNLAAVCMLTLSPKVLFQRGLLLLNISFVEVNLRMTTDRHLPSVSYQIKMQRIMNEYFCVLLFLVMESTAVYLMKHQGLATFWMDVLAATAAVSHNAYTVYSYYTYAAYAKRSLSKKVAVL